MSPCSVPVATLTLAATLAQATVAPSAAHADDLAGRYVTVRVYERAGLSRGAREVALAHASLALSKASVKATFRICGLAKDHVDRCDVPLQAGEMVLRIVRSSEVRPSGGSQRHHQEELMALGDAVVHGQENPGVLATVYMDRVEWMAGEANSDARRLLGYVIAHELGHLLMATSSHDAHGLMRAVWSSRELRLDDATDWSFSTQNVDAMRAFSAMRARAAVRPFTADNGSVR